LMIPIYCLSISHKKAPVRVLESFAIEDIQSALNQLINEGAEECVIVQTCHRLEIYAFGTAVNLEILARFLKGSSKSIYQIESYAEFFEGEEAIRHLFYLAAGLESVIVGETEILHQVEESVRIAREIGAARLTMESIFRAAINCGRIVRRETSICKGSVSIGSLVTKVILRELGSIEGKKLVIIGAGKIGCMIAKSIPRHGTVTIFVANRTYARAERLAREVGGSAVNFDRLRDVVNDADAVVCATASPHLVLTKEDLEDLKSKRLLIVDVSNPRGVDERIKEVGGVKLVDLDQISSLAKSNLKIKGGAIEEAKKIIEDSLVALMERLQRNRSETVVERLMRWAETKRKKAIELAFKRTSFTDDQKKVIDEFSYAFMRDVLMPLAKSGLNLEAVLNEEGNNIQA